MIHLEEWELLEVLEEASAALKSGDAGRHPITKGGGSLLNAALEDLKHVAVVHEWEIDPGLRRRAEEMVQSLETAALLRRVQAPHAEGGSASGREKLRKKLNAMAVVISGTPPAPGRSEAASGSSGWLW